MKSKIMRGSDFVGCSNYVLDDEKNAEIIGGNLSGVTAVDIAEELDAIASQRPDIKKPVWHSALSAVIGEKLSDEKWNEIAQDYMKSLGFDLDKTPYMVVRHHDKPYQHIHIEASRVAVDPSIYLGRNENLKATKITQQLEKKHGLIRTKGPGYDPLTGRIVRHEDSSTKSLTPGERKMSERTGEISPRQRLQEIIITAVESRPTQQEYERRLTQAGVKFKLSSNGYSYSIDNVPFKGSQLGTAFKWAQLQKQFTTPEQAAKLQAEAELQTLYASRRRVWEEENRRRNKYRANRSISHSVCQISYSILPRPLGQAVQIAADIINIISKINDWRDANNYRNQVEKLTARMHQINATRLAAEESKVVQVLPVQKTKPVNPSPVGPVVPKAQSEALPPKKKTNLPIQQPAVESNPPAPPAPVLTAAEIKMLGQANWEMLRYGENRRVRELQAIIHPGLDIDVHRKPCPILVNGVPITEIEEQDKPDPTQGINRTGGRK
jgi:hypothetical protein